MWAVSRPHYRLTPHAKLYARSRSQSGTQVDAHAPLPAIRANVLPLRIYLSDHRRALLAIPASSITPSLRPVIIPLPLILTQNRIAALPISSTTSDWTKSPSSALTWYLYPREKTPQQRPLRNGRPISRITPSPRASGRISWVDSGRRGGIYHLIRKRRIVSGV